jgi:gliding motility-associated-like protein
MDFNGGAPVALTNSMLSITEGGTSMSDAAGNLLFYTNGLTVKNKNHLAMPNGTGLMGDPSTTQLAAFKKPGSTNIYYIFTGDYEVHPNGIRYTEVDMSLNAGLGDVTAVKNVLLNTPSCEKITAIRHCNNQDVWVVTHDYNSNAFRTYLVTAAGVNPVPVISNAGQVVGGATTDVIGQIKGSPNGRKLASATGNPQSFELFDFDPATGIVSNPITFPLMAGASGAYGAEFSPDGTKLYFGSLSPDIYQYDLCAGSNTAIANSGVKIGTSPSTATSNLGAFQIGPDGKIYVARAVEPWVGVINNPNALGVGCNYVDNGVGLAGKNSYLALPAYVNYYFKQPPPPFTMSDTCLTGNFTAPTITGCTAAVVTSLSWNFGDPASGVNNTSAINNPSHIFSGSGTYTVTLVLNYACGTDTLVQNITVTTCGFTATPVPTNILCNAQCTGTANANPSGGIAPYTFAWSNAQTAQTATGLCPGNYTVAITDSSSAIVTVTVTISQPPVLTVTTTSTPTACGNNGSATAGAFGGNPGYTYSWNSSPIQTTQAATGLASGNYSVIVTDANGCSQTQTVTVNSNNVLSTTVASTQTGCSVNNGTATATPANGTAPFTYLWSNGQTTSAAVALGAGNYSVTVTDATGCSQTQTVSVTQTPGIPATASANPTSIIAGDSTLLSAGGGGTYQWSPSAGLSCTTCQNPVATPSGTTVYCVTVTDVNNCTDSACVTIIVGNEPTDCSKAGTLYLPNAFSPNNDGENDVLKIYYGDLSCLKEFELVIYNRWGEKVFETTNPMTPWDGSYRGKPEDTSVFVYRMTAVLLTGQEISKKGNVSLER